MNHLGTISSKPIRAAVGAMLAVAMSFLPQLSVSAAEKVAVCEGFAPESPCEIKKPQVNWFWSSNSKVTVCVPPPEGAPPSAPGVCGPASGTGGVFGNASGSTSPITSGHIGVALKNGEDDMRGYVKFDTGIIPPGADVNSVIMTLNVSTANPGHIQRHEEVGGKIPATVGDERANIIACVVTEPWANMPVDGGDPPFVTRVDQNEVDPSDPDQNDGVETKRVEPTSDCGRIVIGRRSPNGSKWTFDITPFVKAWRGGDLFNEGVVLMPQAIGPAQNWTIEFHGAALTVLPPSSSTNQDPIVWVNAQEASFATADFSGGAPPILPPPVLPPPAPVAPPVIPSFGGGPLPDFTPPDTTVDPGSVPPPAIVPTATVATSAPFWWAMFPIGAMFLGLFGSAVGTDPIAPAGSGEGNRVARVLQRRRVDGDAPGEENDA